MSDFAFRWLHISDLHFGMREQAPQWSNLKHHLYDDLPLLFDQSGPWDVVVFSGDIVQKGEAEEFGGATAAIAELYAKFRSLGCEPKFLAVPGNHDLVRPPKSDMSAMLLRDWHSKSSVREEFLSKPNSSYRETVHKSLSNYESWYEKLADAGIPTVEATKGMLAGDQAARFLVDGRSVGLVALNSTWLQLSDETVAGDLHVDHRQMSAMLPEAEEWCRSNEFNVLITHHPLEWLHVSNRETWKREIAPPGRFDIHLFGHMHEPLSSSLSMMGSSPITIFQSPSLFGREYLSDGTTKRIHGYSAGALTLNGSERALRSWPRTYRVNRSGQGKMVPDQDFHLVDNVSAFLLLPSKITTHQTKSLVKAGAVSPTDPSGAEVFVATVRKNEPEGLLSRFRHHLPPAGPHAYVRKVEQDTARLALNRRALWIVSDWGLSSDKFVSSILESTSWVDASIFRIDLSDIPLSGSDLAFEIEGKLGLKVQELSEELSRTEAVLLLDDITLGERPVGALPRERDLEQLAQAILDYCPSLIILMRTRSNPMNDRFSKVEIGALDEADLKAYISSHPEGGEGLAEPAVVNQIFARTGGVPDQVDRALMSLKVVTLSELVASRDEVFDASAKDSQPLIRVIDELSNTSQPILKRALELLRVLATFPHGAQFEHIKRFNGVHGFYTDNATELMQRGLVIAATLPGLEQSSLAEKRRILSVPRTVRDVVRSQMSRASLERHERRAAELYFGVDWRAGSTNWPADRKYSSAKCSHHEIANASAILNRLLRSALDEGNSDEAKALIRLAATYCDALDTGSHYYSVVSFCSAFLHAAPPDLVEGMLPRINACYANALRMTGEKSRAIEIMNSIDPSTLDRSSRDAMLINLSLALESTNDDRALDVAKEAYKSAKSPALKLQARSIIVRAELPSPERRAKLIALQREARRKKYFVLANNIAIDLANESANAEDAGRYLTLVIEGQDSKENVYNEARAVVKLAEMLVSEGKKISSSEHFQLIKAYQYLFNQRIPNLFDRCHRALWLSFLQQGEVNNLYALFRHSSFIWRIRGDLSVEEEYIASLARVSSSSVVDKRNHDYFQARVQATTRSQVAIAG